MRLENLNIRAQVKEEDQNVLKYTLIAFLSLFALSTLYVLVRKSYGN